MQIAKILGLDKQELSRLKNNLSQVDSTCCAKGKLDLGMNRLGKGNGAGVLVK